MELFVDYHAVLTASLRGSHFSLQAVVEQSTLQHSSSIDGGANSVVDSIQDSGHSDQQRGPQLLNVIQQLGNFLLW